MAAAAEAAAAEMAVAQQAQAMQAPVPDGSAEAASTGPVDGSLRTAGDGSTAEVPSEPPAPTITDLCKYLAIQSDRTNSIIEMMATDKKEKAHFMADARLDEKYSRSVDKSNNTKSGWKNGVGIFSTQFENAT